MRTIRLFRGSSCVAVRIEHTIGEMGPGCRGADPDGDGLRHDADALKSGQ